MKKNKGIAIVLVTVLFTAVFGWIAAFGVGDTASGAAKNIKLGLDLAGGVSITYQAVGETPTEEEMSDTIYKLEQRIQTYSTEAQVYQVGTDRIAVEIPGVTDANAILEELGKPGSLEFQTSDGETVVKGTDIASANAATTTGDTGSKEYVVELTLTQEGTTAFAEATNDNIGKTLPIVYDGEIISNPTVNTAINDGKAQITGMASFDEAEQLASQIRIGSLSVELEELSSSVVGAKLGAQAISTSMKAAAIGLAIVIVFMCVYYLLPGFVSSLALISYTVLMLIVLNAFDVTLTLPGIAGIILSIGMAVDANVIIFARIREEITLGRSTKTAIETGFKKAMSAILDGNITTLIAAAVLQLKGSGTVKGFAQTLAIGIILSMFTALVVTRYLLNALYALGLKDAKLYGKNKEQKTIAFLSKKTIFFGISILAIVSGFVAMGVHSSSSGSILNYSLEFVGGTSSNVTFNEDLSIDDIESKVIPEVSKITGDNNIETQKIADSNQVVIKTRTLDLDEREAFNKAMVDSFGVEEDLITTETISSTVSSEMKSDAIVAVIIAAICMLIYIWFRFKDIRFAASAVLALLHDVLVVLAFYSIFRVSVGTTFIACMLTIVGYSINATIVIFDRIRENLSTMRDKKDLENLVNVSITQTLSRSINTSLTTFVMVAVLYVMGVASVREFAAPLMVGIVCGAYSSVCVTGALWFVLKKKKIRLI